MDFFRITSQRLKGAITILSKTDYDKLRLLEKEDAKLGLSFTVGEGKKIFDIITFTDSLNFAISQKLKNLLESNHITGWTCFPIIIDSLGNEYFAFVITGKAGPILNLEAVNNYETPYREFDIKTWDGSDMFKLENTWVSVITPKVKELIEVAGITNIDISPL